MNLEKIGIKRRLASLALAAALAFGGVQGLTAADVDDAPPDEVAGGTWSRENAPSRKGGSISYQGGATTQGGTWS